MVPQLQSVLIFVHDLDRAIFFYHRTLGFPLRRRWAGGAEVGADGAALTLARAEEEDDDADTLTGRSTGMTFAVDRATYETLAARGVFATEPVQYPWGAFALVADPDGNEFALTAPAAATVADEDSHVLTRGTRFVGGCALTELVVQRP